MVKVTLNVAGMTCGHCVKAVEGSVGELAGVSKVQVHLETGTVDVEYRTDEVTVEQIKEAIDDQGYDVK
ncbi:copper chaperone [Cytobacillus eiseniae]|uniref:Copper chaperone CopZ n=1 Tax=Cytobacillus eiseniae TaxID=762947 RepID=A0ABS4RHT9_9BACI|nr:copper chaperone CopZ [Cytobacillus eiseniae]MBP2242467.1 copper chaperone [Cytobacillus eiseniae]